MIRGKGDFGSLTFFNRLIPNYKRKSLLSKNEIFITNHCECVSLYVGPKLIFPSKLELLNFVDSIFFHTQDKLGTQSSHTPKICVTLKCI